jgi:hypothetical protein
MKMGDKSLTSAVMELKEETIILSSERIEGFSAAAKRFDELIERGVIKPRGHTLMTPCEQFREIHRRRNFNSPSRPQKTCYNFIR